MYSWEGFVLMAAGLFSIVGGITNWNWFMEHKKARFFVKVFTRTGARIFYCVIGAAIALVGVLMVVGIIPV